MERAPVESPARGVFPFFLGRQSSAGPCAKRLGLVPRHVDDRMGVVGVPLGLPGHLHATWLRQTRENHRRTPRGPSSGTAPRIRLAHAWLFRGASHRVSSGTQPIQDSPAGIVRHTMRRPVSVALGRRRRHGRRTGRAAADAIEHRLDVELAVCRKRQRCGTRQQATIDSPARETAHDRFLATSTVNSRSGKYSPR